MRRHWIFAVLLGAAAGALGCHQKRHAAPLAPPTPTAHPPLRLALPELIPAPGVIVIAQLRPATLMASKELRRAWEPVLQTERLVAFQRATGFDLNGIEELWWAAYPLGSLVLVDARRDGDRIEQAFLSSAASELVREQDQGGGRLISAIVHGQPQALYHRAGDFIALSYGDVGLVKIVRGYAQGRLRAKTALRTRFLEPLRSLDPDAPLRVFLAGPFEQAQGVIAQGFAAGVLSVTPQGSSLQVSLHARGLWPEDARSAWQKWWLNVLNASETRAVGLGFPTTEPEVSCHEEAPQPAASNMPLMRCNSALGYSSHGLAQAVHQLTQASSSVLLEEPTWGWRSLLLGTPSAPSTPNPL